MIAWTWRWHIHSHKGRQCAFGGWVLPRGETWGDIEDSECWGTTWRGGLLRGQWERTWAWQRCWRQGHNGGVFCRWKAEEDTFFTKDIARRVNTRLLSLSLLVVVWFGREEELKMNRLGLLSCINLLFILSTDLATDKSVDNKHFKQSTYFTDKF